MYMQRISIYPRSDKVGEARALLQERVKTRQSEGLRAALSELAVGGDGPRFVIALMFNDLAAFEDLRRRNQADASFQAFFAKITSLERKPAEVELFEVVVPMQS